MVKKSFVSLMALLFPFAVLTQLMPVPDVHGETAPVASASATAAATTTADQVTATQAAAASAAAASASATQPVTTQTPAAQLPVAKAEATQPAAVEDAAKAQQQTTTPPDQLVDASTAADQGSSSAPTTTSTSGLTSAQGAGQTAPTESGDSTEDEPAVPTVPNEPGYLDDGSPKAVDPIEFPAAAAKARRAPAAESTRSTGTIGVDHPTAEGEVMLFKQATPVTGMVNTWDVTLRIEGKDVESTADVVLVIDTSGSMQGNRLTTAKQAANSFIDRLLPSDKIRIGIVSFQSDATVRNQLTSQPAGLHTTVNNLAATGGTFTQAAIRQASTMLASSTADHKHIVLLSDGEPTYSYALNNPDTYLIDYPDHGRQTSANALQSAYDYGTRVGVGTSMWYRYSNNGTWWNPSDDKYYNHGNSAIAEAGFTKAAAAQPYLWTIALELGNQGQAVLEAMASPGGFRTSDAAQLNQVFNSIADLIRAAVRGSTVTDPMGIGFQIPNASIGSISASQGTATYDSGTKTISWNPGDLVTPISQGSDIKYAQLTYRIEINDDILNQTPDGNGTYPTNGNATVRYTDANGATQTGTFPVPTVNPVLYKVEKVLVDSDLGPLVQDRNFTVEVTGPGTAAPTSTTRSYTLNAANTTTRLITDLRYASTYTFAEVGDLGDYQVSYQVNGTPTTNLSFFIANDQTDDVTITVTNVYEPIEVTGTKTWVDPLTPTPDVWFQLLRVNPDDTTTKIGGPRTVPTGTNQVTWKQTDADVDATEFVKYRPDQQQYVYRVIEVDETGNDHVPAGYTKTELGLAVTNTFVPTTPTNTTSVRFEKTWAGVPADLTPPTLTVRLLADGTVVRTATLTHPTTAVEWQNLPLKDGDGDLISYTVEESQLNDYDESAVAHTTDVISTVTFTDQTTGLDKPSFVLTRLSGGANQPFIVWTLNHVGDHTAFLNKVITAAEATGAAPQIIADLESYLAGGNTYLLWYEGADVAQDVVPADTQAGQIDIDVTFDGDAIDTASVGFQGAVWTSFVSGTYSSTLATVTNTHNPTGLTLIKAIDGVGLADLPAGVVTPVEASAFTLSATRDQTVVTGAGRVTSTGLEAGTYALSEATTPGIATDYYAAKGEWVCADDETGLPVTVTNATVKLNSGQQITCTVTNATAALTLLKYLPGGDPTQVTLTATPHNGALNDLTTTGQQLTDGKAAITASNTIQVRPGENYTLDESTTIAFLRNGLERYTGPDPANPDMTDAAHWVSVDSATVTVDPGEHAIYRFVNRTAPAVPIPLTGGTGRTAFIVSSALLAVIATTTIAAAVRRRTTRLAR